MKKFQMMLSLLFFVKQFKKFMKRRADQRHFSNSNDKNRGSSSGFKKEMKDKYVTNDA